MHIHSLVEGSETFKKGKFKKFEHKFLDLVKNGQKPKVLFIGCSDSRVMPNLITDTGPGDLFIIRNIGNFVAPYKPDEDYHSTAAAIEYAVSVLKVTDIVVCAHSHCGAIEGLYKKHKMDDKALIHVKKWLDLGEKAKKFVESKIDDKMEKRDKLEMTEKISAVFQLENLLTYPIVKKRVDEGKLFLNAWYNKIENGEIEYYDSSQSEFIPLI